VCLSAGIFVLLCQTSLFFFECLFLPTLTLVVVAAAVVVVGLEEILHPRFVCTIYIVIDSLYVTINQKVARLVRLAGLDRSLNLIEITTVCTHTRYLSEFRYPIPSFRFLASEPYSYFASSLG
jgi:hypothetical protein